MMDQNNNYSYCFRAEEYVHTQSKYNLQFVYFFSFLLTKLLSTSLFDTIPYI